MNSNQTISLSDITELRRFGHSLIEATSDINYIAAEEKIKSLKNKEITEQENYIEDTYQKVLEKVVEKTFKRIQQKLNPQVVSLFLFSKEGYLERYRIEGKDINNRPLENTWLKTESGPEKYEPGQSFSGRAALGKPYGEPYLRNDLHYIIDKLIYGDEYQKKLGFLKCGISVPLDSSHRTFGTLEVLNKLDPQSVLPNKNLEFSQEEVCWLTLLGGHLARAISRIRKKQEERILAKITCLLVDPRDSRPSPQQVYKTITQLFVNPLTPYKACILRYLQDDTLFVKETASTEDINIKEKSNTVRRRGEGMTGKVCESGQYIIKHVDENPEEFFSRIWMKEQRLKSFICFPLSIQGEVVGTLSLFTRYKHQFNPSEIDFLTNVSYLLAAYMVGLKSAMPKKQHLIRAENEYIEKQANLFKEKIAEFRSNPEYLGKYILFENGKVFDKDDNKLELLKRAYQETGPRPVFIEKVSKEEPEPEIWDALPLCD